MVLKPFSIIGEIIEKYILLINDFPLDVIDGFGVNYSSPKYNTNKCEYDLHFWFNRPQCSPLPMIKDKNYKIKIYLINPVINLQLHINSKKTI